MIREALFWASRFAKVAAHTVCMRTKDRVIDSPNITFERARELDPAIPEWAWRKTANYTPLAVTRAQWVPIREFVAETTVRMRRSTVDGVRRMNSMLSGYVNWVRIVHQPPLTCPAVFTQRLVDRYLAEPSRNGWSAAYRYGVSRQLSEVASFLADTAITRLPSAGATYSAKVLTPAEIAKLYSWSQGLSTEFLRRNASALLALSAGAGLDAEEVAAAQVEDIHVDGGLLLINVRGRAPRTVPVMSAWRASLLTAIRGRSSGPVVHGYRLAEYEPRFITNFFTDNPAPIRPSARDLRRGWVIAQIEAGLPVDVLLTVSGFNSAGALDSYLHYSQKSIPSDFFARIAEAGAR